jgi:hypothetical protein
VLIATKEIVLNVTTSFLLSLCFVALVCKTILSMETVAVTLGILSVIVRDYNILPMCRDEGTRSSPCRDE